ncbi:hypothetical protein K9L16_01985 [Candidatus Pacearchaeota archaeon]|nr:hypothetical protein [Candidatus Pacearchaeota archaeon]
MAEQFKRHIAYKYRIGDLLIGNPIFDSSTGRFNFLELGDRQISRVNLIANIIEKFENKDDAGNLKYIFVTLDDGSGQIKAKAFGDDAKKFDNLEQGETVIVIGLLRSFNNETYIAPEIVKKQDPKYLLVRKLELEKERSKKISKPQDVVAMGKEKMIAVKEKILGTIKNAEENGGIEMDKLIMTLQDISPEIINQEVQKMIEEGIVFEPHPGKVRYLG